MNIDIMNMVDFIPLKKDIANKNPPFSISFNDFINGWLEVSITTGDKNLSYHAAYRDLEDIAFMIRAVADLLPFVGDNDPYFQTLRSRSRFRHDLEPVLYIYDFEACDSLGVPAIKILVAEQYSDYNGIWSSQWEFDEFIDEIGGFDNFKKSILLAIELPLMYFVQRYYFAFDDLINKSGIDNFNNRESAELVHKEMNRLKKFIHPKF